MAYVCVVLMCRVCGYEFRGHRLTLIQRAGLDADFIAIDCVLILDD
jgi:hypothetical protein